MDNLKLGVAIANCVLAVTMQQIQNYVSVAASLITSGISIIISILLLVSRIKDALKDGKIDEEEMISLETQSLEIGCQLEDLKEEIKDEFTNRNIENSNK